MIVKKAVTVIQVLLFGIFIFCAAYIGKYYYDSHKAQEEFEILRAEVEDNEDTDETEEEPRAENGMLLAYYDLYNKNNDLRGWLRIDDTVIDYPVVQAKDNEYYLHRNFEKNNQYSGIPFLDYESGSDSANKIIYAHNMKNGTMFAAISKYEKKDFYETHKEISYDTLYERGAYEILAVFRTVVGSENEFKYYEYADIKDERRLTEYINKARALSIYDTGVEAYVGDELVTLSTCAYHASNERLVIVARKIDARILNE